MRYWIKNPAAIYVGETNTTDASGGLVVEDGRIAAHLAAGQTPASAVDETIDASGHLLLPGLINSHHHFYQTLTRAQPSALNKELFPWLKSLYPIWAGLDEEMIYLSTQLACAELLLSGCTLASDHHYIFPEAAPNATDVQVEAVKSIGIRATLCRGSMSLGVEQGGLPPANTVQDEDTILKDSQRVVEQYHDAGVGSMIQIALAPCSPFSVSEALMADTAVLARELGVRLHTHLAETHDETAFCEKTFGARPVDYLERVGWLADDVWLAHGIHFNDDEITRLGKAGVAICHCPGSNMMLSSGNCQTLALEAAGCPVGLGVDGSASNDHSNLASELRQAFLLQRLHYGSSRISHLDALRWATSGSAACLGRDDVGSLAVGKQADIAMYKLDELAFSGVGEPLAIPALCGLSRAERVMIGGRWRVIDGEIPELDLQALMAKHQAASRRLCVS